MLSASVQKAVIQRYQRDYLRRGSLPLMYSVLGCLAYGPVRVRVALADGQKKLILLHRLASIQDLARTLDNCGLTDHNKVGILLTTLSRQFFEGSVKPNSVFRLDLAYQALPDNAESAQVHREVRHNLIPEKNVALTDSREVGGPTHPAQAGILISISDHCSLAELSVALWQHLWGGEPFNAHELLPLAHQIRNKLSKRIPSDALHNLVNAGQLLSAQQCPPEVASPFAQLLQEVSRLHLERSEFNLAAQALEIAARFRPGTEAVPLLCLAADYFLQSNQPGAALALFRSAAKQTDTDVSRKEILTGAYFALIRHGAVSEAIRIREKLLPQFKLDEERIRFRWQELEVDLRTGQPQEVAYIYHRLNELLPPKEDTKEKLLQLAELLTEAGERGLALCTLISLLRHSQKLREQGQMPLLSRTEEKIVHYLQAANNLLPDKLRSSARIAKFDLEKIQEQEGQDNPELAYHLGKVIERFIADPGWSIEQQNDGVNFYLLLELEPQPAVRQAIWTLIIQIARLSKRTKLEAYALGAAAKEDPNIRVSLWRWQRAGELQRDQLGYFRTAAFSFIAAAKCALQLDDRVAALALFTAAWQGYEKSPEVTIQQKTFLLNQLFLLNPPPAQLKYFYLQLAELKQEKTLYRQAAHFFRLAAELEPDPEKVKQLLMGNVQLMVRGKRPIVALEIVGELEDYFSDPAEKAAFYEKMTALLHQSGYPEYAQMLEA